jgi:hypothetical protein
MEEKYYEIVMDYVTKVEESQKILDKYPSDMSGFLVENPYVSSMIGLTNSILHKVLPEAMIDDINWYLWDAPRDKREITVWGKVYLVKTPKDLIKVMKIMHGEKK